MRSSSSGFLLLLVGILAAVGFLNGQLDRWMAWLFQPPGAVMTPATSSATPTPAANTSAPAPAGNRRATSSA